MRQRRAHRPLFRRANGLVVGALLAAIACLISITALAAPPRVASISACGDQILLALADREQIASLSWQADTPLSHLAPLADGLPRNRGEAEQLLAQRVDLVVMAGWGDRKLAAQLEAFGIAVHRMPIAASLAEVDDGLLAVAEAIGQARRGRELVASLRRQRAAIPTPADRPIAAYLRPFGGSAGPGTYVHDTVEASGFDNLTEELGLGGWTAITLEQLLRHPPDAVITSFFSEAETSVMSSYARHPVFRELIADRPVLPVRSALWVCESQHLTAAAAELADQREQAFRDE